MTELKLYECEQSPDPGDEEVDLGKISPESPFFLSMKGNPQNGYLWSLDEMKNVEYISDDMRPLSRYRGTIQTFHFKSIGKEGNSCYIKFIYKRSWETKPYSIRKFSFFTSS